MRHTKAGSLSQAEGNLPIVQPCKAGRREIAVILMRARTALPLKAPSTSPIHGFLVLQPHIEHALGIRVRDEDCGP